MLSGEKRIYKVSETGREITLFEVGPGETCMFTVSSILSNTAFPANAASLTDIEMLLLTAQDFRKLFARHEEIRAFVFSIINQCFASVMEFLNEVTFNKMNQRLIDYLVEKSEDGKLLATHQKIASDLGTAREVVSRLLKDFETKGMILHSRNYIQLINL
jgi:CRP/FNR family transcriptional regulator